jgi:hypothetical protein
MCACALEADHVFLDAVDEEPVGFDVCVSVARPLISQWVVSVAERQGLVFDQKLKELPQLDYASATLLGQLYIAMKSGGILGDAHWYRNSPRSWKCV